MAARFGGGGGGGGGRRASNLGFMLQKREIPRKSAVSKSPVNPPQTSQKSKHLIKIKSNES